MGMNPAVRTAYLANLAMMPQNVLHSTWNIRFLAIVEQLFDYAHADTSI
jgi:hypothetical protein